MRARFTDYALFRSRPASRCRVGRPARRSCLTLISLLAACASLVSASVTQAAELVRFASVGGITDAGLYLAKDLGFFEQAGLNVEMKRMANAPALVTALATDQLDVAGIALTPGLFLASQQGINLRIVGDKQSARPGFSATRMVVRKELFTGNKEESLRALRGKNVAISARASSSFVNVASILSTVGLKVSDVKIAQLAYPSMIAALSNGAVDAAYIIEPYLSEAIQRGIAVEVADIGHLATEHGSHLSVPLVYSENFARKEPVAQAFMTAYVKGVRVYNDAFLKGKDKEKVIDIIARGAGVERAVVENSFPAGLDPNQAVNVSSLEEMQRFFVEQKIMPAPADLSKLVDLSFAKKAVSELGPYQ